MLPNLIKSQRACVSAVLAAAITLLGATGASASCGQMDQPLQLPTNLHVLDNFRAPLCQWCVGNRGIEYQTAPGSVVSAAASGIATFVGTVAGTHYVVVRASNMVMVTHGRLASVIVKTGETVVIGQAIGVAGESLYIGVRVDGRYADPRYCAGLGSRGKPRAVLVAG